MSVTARLVIAGTLAFALGCGGPATPSAGRVAAGAWGGDRLRVDVTAGGATTEYDCGHGTIDEPLVLDGNSRFAASGTHTFDHPGPIRVGEVPDRHPARYDGRAAGDTLQITVTITDPRQTLGSFSVTLGAASHLVKCL